ncbi:transposase [Lactococcus lactis]|uniref:transposase n=1 Tax=Lactococcus lactis TaxID=1358 RepID=UPI00288D273A|nr:transposase [Lactococcus lactis]MDT2909217.1 transposase [Lactococcus lactis]MDT2925253.1 transposase [Lactococcus lactis]MDT2952864.1 transposase [Lactococcus lactis]
MVRTTLIECARALLKASIGKSKKLKSRQLGQPNEVIAYADTAVERMKRRFSRMIYNWKARNKAITAIARELACFIWGMSTGNITFY